MTINVICVSFVDRFEKEEDEEKVQLKMKKENAQDKNRAYLHDLSKISQHKSILQQ